MTKQFYKIMQEIEKLSPEEEIELIDWFHNRYINRLNKQMGESISNLKGVFR